MKTYSLLLMGAMLLILLTETPVKAQLPKTHNPKTGEQSIIVNRNKRDYPDVQNPQLLHIGLPEQWRDLAPTSDDGGPPQAIKLTGDKLALAVFNYKNSGKLQSTIGFKMVDWKSGSNLKLTVELIRHNTNAMAQLMYEGEIEIKRKGAVLPLTVDAQAAEVYLFKVTPTLNNKQLPPVYVEAKARGLNFTKAPKE